MKLQGVSFELQFDDPGLESLVVRRDEIRELIGQSATETTEIVAREFGLSDEAVDGIVTRLGNMGADFRSGENLSDGVVQIPLKEAVVGLDSRDGLSIGSDVVVYDEALPTHIRLVQASIEEEVANLYSAASEFASETSGDVSSTAVEEELADLVDEKELLVNSGIKIAIARRILKYGILPSQILKPAHKIWGLDTWIQQNFERYKSSSSASPEINLEELRRLAEGKYIESGLAAVNFRHAIWTKVRNGLLPIDDRLMTVFLMSYATRIMNNSNHTISFKTESSAPMPEEFVTRALEDIYAPGQTLLTVVK